ncbi:MAG: TolC family protein [Polyangiales bacterium]
MRSPLVLLLLALAPLAPARAQPPEDPAANASIPPPIDRRTLVARAIAASPASAVSEAEVRRARQRERLERSFEAPSLEVQMWNAPLTRPWALGQAEMYMVEVREDLPAPGVRGARASAAAHEGRAARAERSEGEREAAARASVLHAAWVATLEEAALIARTESLVARLREVALARYGTRAASMVDVARLDAELEAIRRRARLVREERSVVEAAIAALLGLPGGTPIGEPTLEAPSTVRVDVGATAEPLASRGELASRREQIAAADDRARALGYEARRPRFGVSLSYWQEPTMRPGYGAAVMMSLPWLSARNRAMADEAREERAVLEAELRALEREATLEASEAERRVRALTVALATLEESELPALERAAEAATTGYATGGLDLPGWLEIHRSTLEARAEAVALRRELETAIAALERVLGTELPRVALAAEESP